jgi:hypothetical protein
LLALATLAARAQQAPPTGSYYPLEVGKHWRYGLALSIEGETRRAIHERTVTRQVHVHDRDAFVVEDKVENELVTTKTLALDGDKVVILSERHEGEAEVTYDPPRLFLDLAQLDTVGAVWSWTSKGGRDEVTTKVVEIGPFVDHQNKIQPHASVVEITSKLKSADGKRTATEERKLWLVRGTGIFREHGVFSPPGATEHKTTTDYEIEAAPPPGSGSK